MYRFFVDLLEPFTVAYILAGVATVVLWRRSTLSRRQRWLAAAAPLILLTLVSLPLVGYFAVGSLEWQYPAAAEPPPADRTIVVLSGWAFRPDEFRVDALLGLDSQWRCLHAARLYRQGNRPRVVVCGGLVETTDVGASLAEMMRDLLVQQGVRAEDILVEGKSRDTYENAVEARSLLEPLGVDQIVLVTKGTHLPRAVACFRAQGFDVTPAGCDYRANEFHWWNPLLWFPRPSAAEGINDAAHEWIGLALYWLRGRL